VPKIFDLISDPKEEYGATLTPNAWVGGPMMKIVAEFEHSLKRYPPIAPGTPEVRLARWCEHRTQVGEIPCGFDSIRPHHSDPDRRTHDATQCDGRPADDTSEHNSRDRHRMTSIFGGCQEPSRMASLPQ
jgi:hypothetical protein